MELQKEFNKKHGWEWWDPKDDLDKLEKLKYGIIALTGETGEFANQIKKISRELISTGKLNLNEDVLENLQEELVDIFAYVLILNLILGFDLEKKYLEKMKINEEKFKKFLK